MLPADAARSLSKDQSKNPPPANWLDRLLRRFSRFAYGAAVLLMYTLASTALGLAPALWAWPIFQRWSTGLPGPLPWILHNGLFYLARFTFLPFVALTPFGVCVMGDVVIGDGATILPESVVLPGSRVGAGETWGGVPARRIEREEMDRIKAEIRGMSEALG